MAHRDLCSTCNHASVCATRSRPDKPVFYCEEFDAYVPVQEKTPARTAANPAESSGKHKGLCSNCENRETCAIPRPEGGIWHCEEYR